MQDFPPTMFVVLKNKSFSCFFFIHDVTDLDMHPTNKYNDDRQILTMMRK